MSTPNLEASSSEYFLATPIGKPNTAERRWRRSTESTRPATVTAPTGGGAVATARRARAGPDRSGQPSGGGACGGSGGRPAQARRRRLGQRERGGRTRRRRHSPILTPG